MRNLYTIIGSHGNYRTTDVILTGHAEKRIRKCSVSNKIIK